MGWLLATGEEGRHVWWERKRECRDRLTLVTGTFKLLSSLPSFPRMGLLLRGSTSLSL